MLKGVEDALKGDKKGLKDDGEELKDNGGIIVLLYLYTCQSQRDFPVFYLDGSDIICIVTFVCYEK